MVSVTDGGLWSSKPLEAKGSLGAKLPGARDREFWKEPPITGGLGVELQNLEVLPFIIFFLKK